MNGRPMPARRPPSGKKSVDDPVSSADNDDSEIKAKAKKKKGKKKKGGDTDEAMEMRSVYENQIASLQESPTRTQMPAGMSTVDLVVTGPPTVEMEEDLLENAEEERRKNKQRLREKRRKEKESPIKTPQANNIDVVYETAQKEIDKVLGPRSKDVGDKARKKSSNKDQKKKKKQKSEDSGDSSSQPEDNSQPPPADTLDEARIKIHRLLDDAFSLISQSRSSMGNKVHPSSQQSSVDKGSPRSQQSHRSHSSIEQEAKESEVLPEKKHTPLYVERTHDAYDRSGLISWSPYRASDDTALISLPNTQTNLQNVAPQREPIKGTTVFSESLPNSLHHLQHQQQHQHPPPQNGNDYYTTLPGEPIVLHSKDLDSSNNRNSTKHSNHPPHPHPQQQHQNRFSSSGGDGDHINVKSSSYNSNQGVKGHGGHRGHHQGGGGGEEELYTPYYGLSSYHELPPPSSVIPNAEKDDNYDNYYYNSTGSDYSGGNNPGNHSDKNIISLRDSKTNRGGGGGGGNEYDNNDDSDYNHHHHHTHNAPSKGRGENYGDSADFVDVIKHSVQPGASPQPLIHSLREELMNLSRKKGMSDSDHRHHHHHNSSGIDNKSTSLPLSSSKLAGKPPSGSATSVGGHDVYYRNSRNKHMKTDL